MKLYHGGHSQLVKICGVIMRLPEFISAFSRLIYAHLQFLPCHMHRLILPFDSCEASVEYVGIMRLGCFFVELNFRARVAQVKQKLVLPG